MFPYCINNLLFETIIYESTYFINSWIPSFAIFVRFGPSKSNGVVTIATTNAPHSLAIFAITGEAPVPVPPPIPAVIITKSAPLSLDLISSSDASAAAFPISGLAPAPNPFLSPNCKTIDLSNCSKTCLSVLAIIKSKPSSLVPNKVFILLFPPPPTPITLIWATGL